MHKLILPFFALQLCVSNIAAFQEVKQEPETEKSAVAKDNKSKIAMRRGELIEAAAQRLIELQHDDGAWPYEGVYRVRGEIPVGYRIGGTSIACSALISANLNDSELIKDPVIRGTNMILEELEHALMEPSKVSAYDVRIWGHIYALDYFCRLKQVSGYDDLKKKTEPWIQELVDAVLFQEIKSGGWNYANKRRHCCFVTSPAVQALMLAKQAGIEVENEVLERSLETLINSRKDEGVFPYSGTESRRDTTAGSIARGPVTEATLTMLGAGDQDKLQSAIDAFHEHWDELEKRRKKNGTHLPPHGIAPYYFYYGHRYAAQAIRMLPKEKQHLEFKKFEAVLMRTKDDDNTWNDRVFEQSKAYGTSMSLLALSRDSVLLPKTIKVEKKETASEN